MQVSKLFQFDDENQQGRTPLCIACEEMLADAVDQTLSPADQAWFDRHIATCADCGAMVADAQRGAAWLEMLRTPRPEPSALLMERILAQTSAHANIQIGESATEFSPVVIGQPAILPVAAPIAPRSNLLAFRPRLPSFAWSTQAFQPRLAMTAAMAFFSIALTLNLTGVRLDQLHANSLSPTSLKRTFYEANADAVRYYDNLRVVRVMESRVDNVRDANAEPVSEENTNPPAAKPAPEAQPEQKSTPKPAPKLGNGPTSQAQPLDRPKFVLASNQARYQHAKKTEGGLA
jgi:hypothetical protein